MKHRYVATAYPGRPAWINGAPYQTWERPRGTVAIDDGDCTFFYRVSRSERAAFKLWAENAFWRGCSVTRIVGAWPTYRVVVR